MWRFSHHLHLAHRCCPLCPAEECCLICLAQHELVRELMLHPNRKLYLDQTFHTVSRYMCASKMSVLLGKIS